MRKVVRKPKRQRENWVDKAYIGGSNAASTIQSNAGPDVAPDPTEWGHKLADEWLRWFGKFTFRSFPCRTYAAACRNFIEGYCHIADIDRYLGVLPPTLKTIGCVISAGNEESMLQAQLDELMRLPFAEIIVVLNGMADNGYRLVRDHPAQATVVHVNEAQGYDAGRAAGAKVCSADIVLFLEGGVCVAAEQLLPFIHEAELGADIVLNPLSLLVPVFAERDAISIVKEFTNRCLHRPDLQIDSLIAVPHAMSRKAIDTIGYRVLAIPSLAQARAVRSGLSIARSSVAVDVFRSNRIREGNSVERLIFGAHLEAMQEIINESG